MAEVTIRAAREQDAEALANLAGQLGYPSTPEATRMRLRMLAGHPEHRVLVAEQHSVGRRAVVGFLHVLLHPSLVHDKAAEVASLEIADSHRGKGIGQKLMERAEEWAKSQGCGMVRLRSNVVRTRAHSFYTRLGYEQWKTSLAFRKQLS